jgi:hypothetical protein
LLVRRLQKIQRVLVQILSKPMGAVAVDTEITEETGVVEAVVMQFRLRLLVV